DALSRVDAGTYGSCIRCGQPIPAARLEVIPKATMCVPCASA
ncbi:MAG: TraR/DksA family transcriptional regulator, partial [Micrococcales bacterium]|nr:TraR/DksA family transcriptional regulator [Micrococcales bacterium]